MRRPKFLSPTALDLYSKNPREYYLSYLADVKPPRIPQTPPMAVGSSFDAFIKNHLHKSVFGTNDPQFEIDTIFEKQVEPHNRDDAKKAGMYLFLEYKKSGAIADLLLDLTQSITPPRFEFDIHKEIGGVPFMGKPDLGFTHKDGCEIVLDWKVNGYYSNSAPSPAPGFLRLRTGTSLLPGHKSVIEMRHKGIRINVATTLDRVKPDWANQLSIYAWCLGAGVGTDFITAIDQIVCKKISDGSFPSVRFAEHRLKIDPNFQKNLLTKAQTAWATINSDHYFRDVTKEESQKQTEMLDAVAESLCGPKSAADKWFDESTRDRNPY